MLIKMRILNGLSHPGLEPFNTVQELIGLIAMSCIFLNAQWLFRAGEAQYCAERSSHVQSVFRAFNRK